MLNEERIIQVDIEEEKDLAMENEVVSIPCIVLFRDGKEVNRIIGLCKKQDILDLKNE